MYDLLLEAKQQYEAELESRIIVYNLDQVSVRQHIYSSILLMRCQNKVE